MFAAMADRGGTLPSLPRAVSDQMAPMALTTAEAFDIWFGASVEDGLLRVVAKGRTDDAAGGL